MSSPLLFAEYLGNIGTLNLTVQFGEDAGTKTSLAVQDNGRVVRLDNTAGSAELTLPAKLLPDLDLNQCLPTSPSRSKTSRLKAQASPTQQEHAKQASILCSARELGIDTSIMCRGATSAGSPCEATLLPEGRISDYRDLPSESWADMMDLWHCHKPEEPEDAGANVSSKGYSASSRLQARPGRAFVDKLSILASPEDCMNIVISQEDDVVGCGHCGCQVGQWDAVASGVKLFKPLVEVTTASRSPIMSTAEHFLSDYLLSIMESSGVRKFQMRQTSAIIWIFSPLVMYSTSARDQSATSAMKIFFRKQNVQDKDASTRLDSQSLHIEELVLAPCLESLLLGALQQSHECLPDEVKHFQDWNVAYLDRLAG